MTFYLNVSIQENMKTRTTIVIALALIATGAAGFIISNAVKKENATAAAKIHNETSTPLAAEPAAVAPVDERINIRANWMDYIAITGTSAKETPYATSGGFDHQWIQVSNKTDYSLDRVNVEMVYTLRNGSTQSQFVKVENMKPGETRTVNVPDWNRGMRMDARIVGVLSESLEFDFDIVLPITGTDPYKLKADREYNVRKAD